MNEELKFNKIIVARHSPENRCFADEGRVLTIIPKKNIALKDHINHFFVDSLDRKIKSQYGWVKSIDEFSLDDFRKKYAKNTEDQNEMTHIRTMLESISRLDDDTPVAATYSQRGVEQKRMDFTVHRVFFRL